MTEETDTSQSIWFWYMVQSMTIALGITGVDLTGRLLGWWGTVPPDGLVLPGPGPIILGFVIVGLYNYLYRRRQNTGVERGVES